VSNDGPLGKPRGIGFGILIFIVTLGIYDLYWSFVTFDELQQHTKRGIGGGIALLIAVIIGVAIPFLAGSEVGKMYDSDGREAPVSGWTGLWQLIPIVGSIVWWVKVQGSLNRYWESKATSPAPMDAATTA
jgi:Domain of unknown function (DUF4234)